MQLQHHPRDRAHLADSRNFACPVRFHFHFAVEQMQDDRAHEDDSIACDDENWEPRGKSPVIRIELAPVRDAQRDDAAEEQALVRDRIEDYTKRAALIVMPRDIAIEPVANRGEQKNNDRRVSLPFERRTALNALAIINRHRDKHRNHQNPNDCNFVGRRHLGAWFKEIVGRFRETPILIRRGDSVSSLCQQTSLSVCRSA